MACLGEPAHLLLLLLLPLLPALVLPPHHRSDGHACDELGGHDGRLRCPPARQGSMSHSAEQLSMAHAAGAG